jgi:hypothetical protein
MERVYSGEEPIEEPRDTKTGEKAGRPTSAADVVGIKPGIDGEVASCDRDLETALFPM